MAEFYNIDPWECSLEELEKNVNSLQALSEFWDSMQLGSKLILNSSYGACASKWFFMHNVDVAEAITLQGQDLNHYSEDTINKYINEQFVKDVAQGKFDEYNASVEKCKFIKATASHGLPTAAVGGDTDSIYVTFDPIIKHINVPKDKAVHFCVDVTNKGLGPYLDSSYDEYAKRYNCDKNYQAFELEKIARTCLYYAKKKYSMEVCWEEPNIFLAPMSHVIYKGLEVVQGSTPKYARECQIDFIKFVHKCFYETEKKPSYSDCIAKLKEYKTKFMLQDPNDICKGQNIGDYEKFIVNDKPQNGAFEYKLHCPIHVKAAGLGNYMLFKNKKFLSKYSILKTSSKCKFYYTTDPVVEVFGFEPGKFPAEYAPGVDYEIQFQKVILDPLNRLISDVLGYQPLNSALIFTNALF